LGGMYHPESVQHILNAQKERGPLTLDDAKQLDQEWAASRLAEFTRGHRGGRDMMAHIMQETPNNAATDSPDVRRARKEVERNPNSELKATSKNE
jgi:hypothetical protein